MFQAFAKQNEHQPGEPAGSDEDDGSDLLYVVNLRSRMNQVADHEEIWGGEYEFNESNFVPRTDPGIEDASGGLPGG